MLVHIGISSFWSIFFHSFWTFTEFFFSGGVRERKSRARVKTMKITRHCWCLDAQVNVMIPWFSRTLPTMNITSATHNTTSLRSSSSLSIVPPPNASLKAYGNMYNTKVLYVINYVYPSWSIICCIIKRCFVSFHKNSCQRRTPWKRRWNFTKIVVYKDIMLSQKSGIVYLTHK